MKHKRRTSFQKFQGSSVEQRHREMKIEQVDLFRNLANIQRLFNRTYKKKRK